MDSLPGAVKLVQMGLKMTVRLKYERAVSDEPHFNGKNVPV